MGSQNAGGDQVTLESSILERIIPDQETVSRIDGTAKHLKDTVQAYMDEHGIDAELKLVGSYSKGTYLSNPDLDLFIMFPVGTSREELVETGLRIGEEVLHGSRMYAEHPYTSAVFEGVDVDLVPNIHIKSTEELVTAVDRTPFHTDYVLAHMKEGQNNQIRLLKKFMKGIGAYGAEPNVRGFSGYLCELLVLRYGTFLDTLKAASETWREGIQISIEKPARKLEGPLVFYDPVDGKRNVASAVHVDTMARFVYAAKEYLEHPSERFFFPVQREIPDRERLREMCEGSGGKIVTVTFDKPNVVDDNVYSQVWKTEYAIRAKLDSFGFGCMRSTHLVSEGKMRLAFLAERDSLSPTHIRVGPPPWGRNSGNFLTKWKDSGCVTPFIEDGKWCAVVPRQYTEVGNMLAHEMAQAGIGKEIALDSMEIATHEESIINANPSLLTELVAPKYPWEN